MALLYLYMDDWLKKRQALGALAGLAGAEDFDVDLLDSFLDEAESGVIGEFDPDNNNSTRAFQVAQTVTALGG